MKRKSCFGNKISSFCALAAGLFLLPACGKVQERVMDSVTAVMKSDYEYRYVAESGSGYYFWECRGKEHPYQRLLFMDKGSGTIVPLCNKPDCMHDGNGCNAYFPGMESRGDILTKRTIQYYEGSLYALGLSSDGYVALFRIEEDGSEWEVSTKLYRTDYASTGQWVEPAILIHGGYVYMVDSKQEIMKLERVPIDGGAAEIIFEKDDNAVQVLVYRMKNEGESIFFQVYTSPDESMEHAEGGLYRYDETTKTCSLIKPDLIGPYSIINGVVYYENAEGFCCYSIKDGTTEVLAEQYLDVPNIISTKEYIFVFDQMGDRALTVYDHTGAEIFCVTDGVRPTQIFGGNSEILFGACADEVGLRLCFLDLTRPLDELKWEELKAD